MVNRYQASQTWGNHRPQPRQYPRSMHQPMRMTQPYPSYPSLQMRRFGQMGPYGHMQTKSRGGLLAKLFGKNTPQTGGGFLGIGPSAARGAMGGAGSSGSFLQTLTNPTAITGFLNNTQQVLNAFQQITPLVSQYGPIVKNLPAMWRLYRGFKDATSTNDEEQEENTVEIEESTNEVDAEESSDSYSTQNSAVSDSGQTSDRGDSFNRNSRTTSSSAWIYALEAEESSSYEGIKERRSFPRMYI